MAKVKSKALLHSCLPGSVLVCPSRRGGVYLFFFFVLFGLFLPDTSQTSLLLIP